MAGVEEELRGRTPERPLRVLLVIKCLGYGGAERCSWTWSRRRTGNGSTYEVAYVLRQQDALVPAIVTASGRPFTLSTPPTTPICGGWRPSGTCWSTGDYDVVHFHLPYAAALGQLVVDSLPRAARPGIVYTEHSLWDRVQVREPGTAPRLSMARGERLVTVSKASYDALPAALQRRATTVVHGVDLSRSDSLIARREELRDLRAVRARSGTTTSSSS